MKVEHVPIDSIKENPTNPRTIDDDKFNKLVASIKSFPEMLEMRPIVVNADRMVLGGNMRLKACREAGLATIPIIDGRNLTDEQQREFIIKDNLGYGRWDWEMINKEWDIPELEDWGLDVRIYNTDGATEDNYEIPDHLKTDIVPGDLFEIGAHRLLCGDATLESEYQKLFGEQMADLVVTDPPYNINYQGKTKDKLKIENDQMEGDAFHDFLLASFSAQLKFTKPGGVWYVWYADSEGRNFRNAFYNAGIKLRQNLIWVKNAQTFGHQDYGWKHEPCLYGWKEGAAHGWYSDAKQTTILEYDRPRANDKHPTMKPVAMIGALIRNSSKEGDIVADPFGGSGTTMVACEQMGRRAFLIDIDPVYCQATINRLKELRPEIQIKRNGKKY